MPLIVFPLGINFLILAVAWMSQLSLYFYSVLVSDSEWLKITSYVIVLLFNATIVGLGVIYNIMTMVVPPVLLVIMFLIWIMLPRTVVIQEKEGSRE